jgi:hypothetical protein
MPVGDAKVSVPLSHWAGVLERGKRRTGRKAER